MDSPSTPADPLFALTLRYASQTIPLGMANGFGFGSLSGSSLAVDRRTRLGNASPLLHPHCRASSLIRDAPPPGLASVLSPLRFLPLGVLPLGRATHRAWSRLTSRLRVPSFHTGA